MQDDVTIAVTDNQVEAVCLAGLVWAEQRDAPLGEDKPLALRGELRCGEVRVRCGERGCADMRLQRGYQRFQGSAHEKGIRG